MKNNSNVDLYSTFFNIVLKWVLQLTTLVSVPYCSQMCFKLNEYPKSDISAYNNNED